jgi:hypothetical protein
VVGVGIDFAFFDFFFPSSSDEPSESYKDDNASNFSTSQYKKLHAAEE